MTHPDNAVYNTPLSQDDLLKFQAAEKQAASGAMHQRYGIVPEFNIFELYAEDELLAIADARLEIDNGQLIAQLPGTVKPISLLAEQLPLAQAVLKLAKEPVTLQGLAEALSDEHSLSQASNAVSALLGKAITAQPTLDRLNNAIPLESLVRMPMQSAYATPRSYWENSIAVRDALPRLYEACGNKKAFAESLSGLHRLATMGYSGVSYYGGGGGWATIPGQYRVIGVSTSIGPGFLNMLSAWIKALGVPVKLVRSGVIKSTTKRDMVEISENGRLCNHLAKANGLSVLKLVDDARVSLLDARQSKDNKQFLAALARCVQLLAVAHPFHNINFSVAMNIANDCLTSRGFGYLPHLYIDYLAQRTRPGDFAMIFQAIVHGYCLKPDDPAKETLSRDNIRKLLESVEYHVANPG